MPASMHSAGRTHSATKATILPVFPAVIAGRTSNTAVSAIVTTINATRIPVDPITLPSGAFARSYDLRDGGQTLRRSLLLGQTSNVSDKPLDLSVGDLALVCRHRRLPIGNDGRQSRVGLLLPLRGPQIAKLERLARRGVAASVPAVATPALRLEDARRVVLRAQRRTEKT